MKRYLVVALLAAVACENDVSSHPTAPLTPVPHQGAAASVANTAVIYTDRDDYSPGDTVVITGFGFFANERVTITLHEDPAVHPDRILSTTGDARGTWSNRDFVTEPHHLNVRFVATASGNLGSEAQTTFTDATRPATLAILGVQLPNPVTAGNSVTYGTNAGNSVRVSFTGVGSCTVALSATGLPAGATATFAPNTLTGTFDQSLFTFLSVSTTAVTPGGTVVFTVRAQGTGGVGNDCTSANVSSGFAALTVTGIPATTLTLGPLNPASVPFGSSGPVPFSATLTRTLGPWVSGATITFSIDGSPAGSGVTNSNGVATLNYNPGTLAVGAHPVTASFAGGSVNGIMLAASTSGSQTLTVTSTTPTLTWTNPADVVYGTSLSSTQLNATASAPGTFVYTPASGTVLQAGNAQALHVDFTPSNPSWLPASKNVQINILKKQLDVTAKNVTKTYGDAIVFAGTEFTSNGLVAGDAISSVTLTSAGAAATAPVSGSPYSIVASSAVGTGLGNYTLSYHDGQLVVSPAPLMARADDKTKIQGGANPPLTGALTGIRNGDNISATYSTTTVTLSPPGTYPIVPALLDPSGKLGNYTPATTNGSLVVTPNAPPVLGPITAPTTAVQLGTAVTASASFTDVDVAESAPYTATVQWGDGTTTTQPYTAPGTVSASHAYVATGLYTITMTVRQDNIPANQDTEQFSSVVIFDRAGGTVTGGGWIDAPAGAFVASPTTTGKATFGLEARYDNATGAATGNTEVQLHATGANFKSVSYDWLVITGAQAQYRGTGTLDGQSGYGFLVSVADGALGVGAGRFRVKIWEQATGHIVFDSQPGADGARGANSSAGGGSIQIKRR